MTPDKRFAAAVAAIGAVTATVPDRIVVLRNSLPEGRRGYPQWRTATPDGLAVVDTASLDNGQLALVEAAATQTRGPSCRQEHR